MHDARPQLAADAAQILYVVQECVDQGAVRVTRGRMHHHAGRLVDDDQIRVVVENVQGQRLGPRRRRGGRRDVHPHEVAGADGDPGARGGSVEADQPVPDQSLDLRPRSAAETGGEKLVQTDARVVRLHFEVDVLGRWRLAAVAGGHDATGGGQAPARAVAGRGVDPPARASRTSITMLSGTRSSDTNCEVDSTSKTVPRGSPR